MSSDGPQSTTSTRLQREFECTVCKGFPRNAMHCKQCQQIICDPCSQHIKSGHSNCPNCRHTPFEVEANQPIRRAVESICVICEHCGASVRWAESEEHETICAKDSVTHCCGAVDCKFETTDRRAAFDHIEKVHGLELWRNFTTVTNELSRGIGNSHETLQNLEIQTSHLKEENERLKLKLFQIETEVQQNRQHDAEIVQMQEDFQRQNQKSQHIIKEVTAQNELLKTDLEESRLSFAKLEGKFTQFKQFVARRLKPIMEIVVDSTALLSTNPTKISDGFSAEPYHMGTPSLPEPACPISPTTAFPPAASCSNGSLQAGLAAASKSVSHNSTHSPERPSGSGSTSTQGASPTGAQGLSSAPVKEPPAKPMPKQEERSPFEVHGQGHEVYATTEWQFTSAATNSIVLENDMLLYMYARRDRDRGQDTTTFQALMDRCESCQPDASSCRKGIKHRTRTLKLANSSDYETMVSALLETTHETLKLHVPLVSGLKRVENKEFYATLTAVIEALARRQDAQVSVFNHPGLAKTQKPTGIVYEQEIYCAAPRKDVERIVKELQQEMRGLVARFLPSRFTRPTNFRAFDLLYDANTRASNCKILVYQGDIVSVPVDAIVNAANKGLNHSGGVAAAISKAAGPELQKFCTELVNTKGKLITGDAVVTPSFGDLPCLHVIHVVGPHTTNNQTEQLGFKASLKLAIKNAFASASQLGCRSIAMPLISSGLFGGAVLSCARVLWDTLVDLRNEICEGGLEELHIVERDSTRLDTILEAARSADYKSKLAPCYDYEAASPPPLVLLPPNSTAQASFAHDPRRSNFTPDVARRSTRSSVGSSDVAGADDVPTDNLFAPSPPNQDFDPSLLVLGPPTLANSPAHDPAYHLHSASYFPKS